jgi:DNA alkylation damage repair protein AlkB
MQDLIYRPEYLDREAQAALLADIRAVIAAAPLFQPRMPRTGKPFSVRMTNSGPVGWVSDEAGYRYQPTHPETGRAWPPIPNFLLRAWDELSGYPHPPEACLVNFYAPGARMGLHQDRDETDFSAPVPRFRSATTRCSGSAARAARIRRARSGSARATPWCSPGDRASPSTGSIVCFPARRGSCRRAAESI